MAFLSQTATHHQKPHIVSVGCYLLKRLQQRLHPFARVDVSKIKYDEILRIHTKRLAPPLPSYSAVILTHLHKRRRWNQDAFISNTGPVF